VGVDRKRLTNTPVHGVVSVLKLLDDCRKEVVGAQTTYARGSSAVGGGVCEQRHATQRVLSDSAVELRHAESSSEEATLAEKEQSIFFGQPIGVGGGGRQEISEAAGTELWARSGAVARAPDRGTS
jgi:hypothetical protein